MKTMMIVVETVVVLAHLEVVLAARQIADLDQEVLANPGAAEVSPEAEAVLDRVVAPVKAHLAQEAVLEAAFLQKKRTRGRALVGEAKNHHLAMKTHPEMAMVAEAVAQAVVEAELVAAAYHYPNHRYLHPHHPETHGLKIAN
jgi:hypothetical protein